MSIEFPRFTACAIVEMAEGRGQARQQRCGKADKSRTSRRTVGCFASAFPIFAHRGSSSRCARHYFANDFSEYRTSRVQL